MSRLKPLIGSLFLLYLSQLKLLIGSWNIIGNRKIGENSALSKMI